MNVLILAEHEMQLNYYKQRLWFASNSVRFHYARDERYLCGLVPDLIIELPDWPRNKSENFMNMIDMMKKRMRK